MIHRYVAILIAVLIGIAIFIPVCILVFKWRQSNSPELYVERYRWKPTSKFKFTTRASQVAPQSNHPLSRNGPYIDTHFKDMNAENPIGQTYYQRPITSYDSKNKVLMIYLSKSQPTIHMNSNTVTRDVAYEGLIRITDFTYGKHNPNSEVVVDVSLVVGLAYRVFSVHVLEMGVDVGPITTQRMITLRGNLRCTGCELELRGRFPPVSLDIQLGGVGLPPLEDQNTNRDKYRDTNEYSNENGYVSMYHFILYT